VRGEVDSSETALANLILADEIANSDLDDWAVVGLYGLEQGG
jgi:hypothetical protein